MKLPPTDPGNRRFLGDFKQSNQSANAQAIPGSLSPTCSDRREGPKLRRLLDRVEKQRASTNMIILDLAHT